MRPSAIQKEGRCVTERAPDPRGSHGKQTGRVAVDEDDARSGAYAQVRAESLEFSSLERADAVRRLQESVNKKGHRARDVCAIKEGLRLAIDYSELG
jgi:hypothetical protein